MSFYIDPFNRLFLHVIQRHTAISNILEINSFQVYATDVAIVHGAIINDPISRIRDYCELRSARDISRCFPPSLSSAIPSRGNWSIPPKGYRKNAWFHPLFRVRPAVPKVQ